MQVSPDPDILINIYNAFKSRGVSEIVAFEEHWRGTRYVVSLEFRRNKTPVIRQILRPTF